MGITFYILWKKHCMEVTFTSYESSFYFYFFFNFILFLNFTAFKLFNLC